MEGLSYESKLMLLVLALFFHNGFFLCNENSRHTKELDSKYYKYL